MDEKSRYQLQHMKTNEFSNAKAIVNREFSVVDRLYGASQLKGKKIATEKEPTGEHTAKLLSEFESIFDLIKHTRNDFILMMMIRESTGCTTSYMKRYGLYDIKETERQSKVWPLKETSGYSDSS